MLEDAGIVKLFFDRSEAAIEEVDRKYGSGCRGIARNILGNEEDAEESVSDAYMALWNQIPPERPDPLRSYLFRIVRNLSITRYHRDRAQKRNSSYDVAIDELEFCLSGKDDIEDTLAAEELTVLLNVFLSGLDRESRVLFVRRYWYGDSMKDLAEMTGLRRNTVSVRLLRMREKLREYLIREGVSL